MGAQTTKKAIAAALRDRVAAEVGARHPPAVRAWLVVALLLSACTRPRGAAGLGEPCRSDFDCGEGHCAGPAGEQACVPSCARDADCPRGWTCHGLTHNGVVVCARGEAVPMPH